jgi:membrane-bound lytic murein transglycosylase MltF
MAKILSAFSGKSETGDLSYMKDRGYVRALVTFSKTDFFLDTGRPRGMQAELLQQYEQVLNAGLSRKEKRTRVVYVLVPFDRLLQSLTEGKGDIAAGLLTITPQREKEVVFVSGRRLNVDEIVVTSTEITRLNGIEDLSGKTVYVLRGSSYATHLQALNARLRAEGKPPVTIQEADENLLTEDILEMVNAGVVDITIADDYKARLWARVLPDLVVREDLKINADGHVGWAVRKGNPELIKSLNRGIKQVRKGTKLGNIIYKRYYENTSWIKNPLEERERRKFGEFVDLFKRYGHRYGFDYLAVAAQSYQESGFDPGKRSPRGALGLMQVLPATAADPNVAIPDIEDPENNIHAGVKYLAYLRDRYYGDASLAQVDRFAFAWAAYNAGPARVSRMRDNAREMGLNPDRWFNNVEHAALELVGQETVQYVANIYKYLVAYSLSENIARQKKDVLNKKPS